MTNTRINASLNTAKEIINALIPVLFTSNKELIPIYKQFEKNWGKFNFEVSFIQDDDYEDLAPRYEINFMTGEWTDIYEEVR